MVNTIRRPRSEIYDFRSTFSLTLESLLCVAATYTLGGTAFKHSPFRAASPARQPRALARLGARAARLEPETLLPLFRAALPGRRSSAPFPGLIAVMGAYGGVFGGAVRELDGG